MEDEMTDEVETPVDGADAGAEEAAGEGQNAEAQAPETVPAARLGEVVAERNALRKQLEDAANKDAEIAELRQMVLSQAVQPAAEPAVDVDALRSEMMTAINEGESSKAAQIMAQIEDANLSRVQREIEEKARAISDETVTRSQQQSEQQQYAAAVQQVMKDHPEFDQDSAAYDSTLTRNVETMMHGFVAQGTPRAEALAKAIDTMVPAPQKKQPSPFEDRAVTQRANNIAEVRDGKPAMQTAPNRSHVEDTPDIEGMSRAEFKAYFNSKEGRKARGDFLAEAG